MNVSAPAEDRDFYDASSESYAEIMDAEIELPLYTDVLGRLAKRVSDTSGAVVDTSCGPGHILFRFHERFDSQRPLIGVDLSTRMIGAAASKLSDRANVIVGDMGHLPDVGSECAAAVLSFFAIHHVHPEGRGIAVREWHRILSDGG